MNDPESNNRASFIGGNALLALGAVMILWMGPLWEWLGAGALLLWMAVAVSGVYLLMKDA